MAYYMHCYCTYTTAPVSRSSMTGFPAASRASISLFWSFSRFTMGKEMTPKALANKMKARAGLFWAV